MYWDKYHFQNNAIAGFYYVRNDVVVNGQTVRAMLIRKAPHADPAIANSLQIGFNIIPYSPQP